MEYKQIKIGEIILPSALKTDILMRAFKEKDLKEIWEAYEGAKLKTFRSGPPTELQKKIAKLRRDGSRPKAIARQLKVEVSVVNSAIHRVAVYEYLNK